MTGIGVDNNLKQIAQSIPTDVGEDVLVLFEHRLHQMAVWQRERLQTLGDVARHAPTWKNDTETLHKHKHFQRLNFKRFQLFPRARAGVW